MAFDLAVVMKSGSGQRPVAGEVVRANGCPLGVDCLVDERAEIVLEGDSFQHLEAEGSRPVVPVLHRPHHDRLVADLPATSEPPLPRGPHVGLIDFDEAKQRPEILLGHSRSQLVEQAPCRLVAPKARILLELQRRDPTLVAGQEEDAQEPDPEGHLGPMQHGAGRHRSLIPTVAALLQASLDELRAARMVAPWASKAEWPARLPQGLPTGRLIREDFAKLQQGAREFHDPDLLEGQDPRRLCQKWSQAEAIG